MRNHGEMDEMMINQLKSIEMSNLDVGYIINYKSKSFDELINEAANILNIVITKHKKLQLKSMYEKRIESIKYKYCQILGTIVHICTNDSLFPDMFEIYQ